MQFVSDEAQIYEYITVSARAPIYVMFSTPHTVASHAKYPTKILENLCRDCASHCVPSASWIVLFREGSRDSENHGFFLSQMLFLGLGCGSGITSGA